MNIDELQPGQPSGLDSEARPTALKNRLGWLQEWEQAQWQQRMRDQIPSPGANGGTPEDGDGVVAREPAQRAATKERTADASRPRPAADGQTAARHADSRSVEGRVVATDARAMGPQVAAGPGLPQPVSAFGAGLKGQLSAWLSYARPVWPSRYMHVMQTAAGLRIWIRDFRAERGEGQRLLAALRAHCAGAGCRLASVSLNGELLWQAPRARPDEKDEIRISTTSTEGA